MTSMQGGCRRNKCHWTYQLRDWVGCTPIYKEEVNTRKSGLSARELRISASDMFCLKSLQCIQEGRSNVNWKYGESAEGEIDIWKLVAYVW